MNMFRFLKNIISYFKYKPFSKEAIIESVKKYKDLFSEYGIDAIEVYLLYCGIDSKLINEYFLKHKQNLNDILKAEESDYVSVIGCVANNDKKYILLILYSEIYDRKIGNYCSVEEWPDFGTKIYTIEEVEYIAKSKFEGNG
jgi:hypothetical protein